MKAARSTDIVAEARSLAAGGVRELNLIAQDLTAYGRDLKPQSSLAALLREALRGSTTSAGFACSTAIRIS